MLIPLHRLVFKPTVPAGMDWSIIGLWYAKFRKTAEPCDPPIKVSYISGTDIYQVEDGRHRFVAAVMAGRTHIDAEFDEPKGIA